ncbi:MAG: phospholipase D-like domain-containing protein [Gemmatimonadaceae bacterium]
MSTEAVSPSRSAATLPEARSAPTPSTARVDWLVDNADAYAELLRAIRTARRSICISQLAFDADCVAEPAHRIGRNEGTSSDALLADAVLEVAARQPVDVRILLNASVLLNTARPLHRFFASNSRTDRPIRVRGMNRFPALLHAKMVLIDGREAFLFGSPFVNGYFDDRFHHPVDARRPSRELGGRPVHDLSVRVTGPAVRQLELIFAELWADSSAVPEDERHTDPAEPPLARANAKTGALRMARSVPRNGSSRSPGGETDILSEMLMGLDRARSCIYIEAQYLSAPSIVSALTRAPDRHRSLELILVLNQNPDVTAYRRWQNRRLTDSGLLTHARVGVFALWSTDRAKDGSGSTLINQLFVHSKVMMIDDRWVTVGSANLDGVSLDSYGNDFTSRIGRRVFRNVRNFDVNIVLDTAAGADHLADSVRELRTRLWAEHLGMRRDRLAAAPAGGWLQFWRGCASRNVAALSLANRRGTAEPPAEGGGFVMPYSTRSTPAQQLADLGIRVDSRNLRLQFDPGWLEVHCSPNWVRNMFL